MRNAKSSSNVHYGKVASATAVPDSGPSPGVRFCPEKNSARSLARHRSAVRRWPGRAMLAPPPAICRTRPDVCAVVRRKICALPPAGRRVACARPRRGARHSAGKLDREAHRGPTRRLDGYLMNGWMRPEQTAARITRLTAPADCQWPWRYPGSTRRRGGHPRRGGRLPCMARRTARRFPPAGRRAACEHRTPSTPRPPRTGAAGAIGASDGDLQIPRSDAGAAGCGERRGDGSQAMIESLGQRRDRPLSRLKLGLIRLAAGGVL
jgi:hypothetical protein